MMRCLIPIVCGLLLSTSANAVSIAVPENLGPWGLSASLPSQERGIYADLAEMLAKQSTVPVEIRFVPYGRMMQEIKSGGADYAFGVIGPSASEAGPFIATLAKVPMVAVARKGLALRSLEDLHDFKEVGFLRGGICGKDIDADGMIRRVAQDSYESAIRKLAAGRLDGWCSIKAGFTYALSGLKMEDSIGDQIEYAYVQIGFQVNLAKRDTQETKALSAAIDQLVSSGEAGKVFARYLGKSYQP